MWFLYGLGIWILGMFVFYILDGWLDYGFDKDQSGAFALTSATWPLWIWWYLPCYFAGKAHDTLKEKRIKRNKRIENEKKIRVAQQREIEKIEAELDLDIKNKNRI